MKRAWDITQLAFVWLLIAIGFFGLFRVWTTVASSLHSKKDFWDIASAVGTCGAVVAALYIASSERRRRTREALVTARITASSVIYRLAALRDEVIGVRMWIRETIDTDNLPANFAYQLQVLSAAARCSIEEVRSLQPLPNYCAVQIAGAQDRVDVASHLLASQNLWLTLATRPEKVFGMLHIVYSALLESESLLSSSIKTCQDESVDVYIEMNADTRSSTVKLARRSMVATRNYHPKP
ncbi:MULTISPECIES: hypothetical protein [unclassified Burkholderia]|nr:MULTISPECIES: hypothetical protein [unclassified Burkholderia]NIE82675.1 hypothetical protein [Burkholderia sp. Tr-860]NIF61794.1 hypothetical protein [Burkholderia sp. Cy-647]NIF94937.1 hypothetical protein [Burkholderia sp. Ax-1720]